MDPDKCFHNFKNSLAMADTEMAIADWHSLRGWLLMGGFEPAWTADERKRFNAYVEGNTSF